MKRLITPPASSEAALHRMQAAKAKNTAPEIALRSQLYKKGLRYRLDKKVSPLIQTRVDIVFPTQHVAIFVDGCFWHGCPRHGTQSKSNSEYWYRKIKQNKERDWKVTRQLRNAGWKVIRIWEHEIIDNLEKISERIMTILKEY